MHIADNRGNSVMKFIILYILVCLPPGVMTETSYGPISDVEPSCDGDNKNLFIPLSVVGILILSIFSFALGIRAGLRDCSMKKKKKSVMLKPDCDDCYSLPLKEEFTEVGQIEDKAPGPRTHLDTSGDYDEGSTSGVDDYLEPIAPPTRQRRLPTLPHLHEKPGNNLVESSQSSNVTREENDLEATASLKTDNNEAETPSEYWEFD